MRNKGAIKLFAILLALVCLFQLSFTFVTRSVEKKAKEYASSGNALELAKKLSGGDQYREKQIYDSLITEREKYYLDSIANEPVYNLLIRKYTYLECKEREINLGLDLRGGMNVILEVSVIDVIRALSNYSTNPSFLKALERASEMQKNSQEDFVTLFQKAFEEVNPGAKLAPIFATIEMKDRITFNSTNEEVIKVIRQEAEGAIDRTYRILKERIDRFGITQPNVQQLSQKGRILVELPGVKEPERVRKLLQTSAKLEFWETFEYSELFNYFDEANKKLKDILTAEETKSDTLSKNNITDSLSNKQKESTNKDSSLVDQLSQQDTTKKQLSEEEWRKENPLFALLRPAIVQDEKGNYYPGKGPTVGYCEIKDTAKVGRYLRMKQIASIFPRELKLAWTAKPFDKEGKYVRLIALKVRSRDGRAPLEGDAVVSARQDFTHTGGNEISMVMNSEGAQIWKRLTGENIGRCIAIVLDGLVYSYPVVNSEIPNGRSSITGNFTLNEAKDLANVLQAGKLPAPARIVHEAVVGPTLGQEAINKGFVSFIVAFLLILLYMALYYSRAGIIADIALISNIFFLIGVLASLGAVLTLPGIAGIVLTLGMAVDANVIIYERIKEELRAGKGLQLAISDGYKNAYSAIIDGNLTTIITGIILFTFGSGPIQGFATTLIIGICTSLFSAIFISRLIFEWMLKKKYPVTFDNKVTAKWFTNVKFDFIKVRKKLYILSASIILIGIISLIFKGLQFGVEFSGGRTYIIRFDNDIRTDEIRAAFFKEFKEGADIKTYGGKDQIRITTKYLISDTSTAVDSIIQTKLYNALNNFNKHPLSYKEFVTNEKPIGIQSIEKVGPTIADDIKKGAVWAVTFALIAIFIYIAIRFKKWQYGLGGVISLFHDSLIVISVYSLFSNILPFNMEIDQAFIAAILTVIGYSINDTVIIFDRIREYNILYPKRELENNMNAAMNSTLGRTFNTSMTTIITLLIMFIFGGEVIRGFIFALLVGITVGTYSSIFNATPIAYDLIKLKEKKQNDTKNTEKK